MRPVFDAIDAGRFDAVFVAVGLLVVALAASEWWTARRAR